ncbi:hypothetical protein LZ32DRAFT_265963 [Colletotrichum eremochloae]|nr:hypothetical protein LZ32DRAFT_265963 [Colletotrichum eremochloae]
MLDVQAYPPPLPPVACPVFHAARLSMPRLEVSFRRGRGCGNDPRRDPSHVAPAIRAEGRPQGLPGPVLHSAAEGRREDEDPLGGSVDQIDDREDHEDRPSYVVVHRPLQFQSMWAFHGKAHPAMRTQRSRTSISEAILGKNSLFQELQTGYRACDERIWKLSGYLDSISRGEGTSSVPDLYQWRNAWAQRNYQVLRNASSTELFRAGALEELQRVFLRRSPMGISYRHGTGST